ncbi:class I SAM-dependent methyltransferase [Sphingomonas sp. RB3P16]|uniref:class I SAM-dependent methyltransferase n=1 Tax=Parasphingomonas frigoris TaxID=3096163 RepID=UPI002FCB2B93
MVERATRGQTGDHARGRALAVEQAPLKFYRQPSYKFNKNPDIIRNFNMLTNGHRATGAFMPALHTSDLAQYVEDAKSAPGGYQNPDIVAKYEPIDLVFETKVDQTLSPYSDAYFEQQMALYSEIAGRPLDQGLGELHGDDIESLYKAPNPLGIQDCALAAEYVRSISTMLALACLKDRPTILDMGAGHGLGSEVLAYASCVVHAVDIDADLGRLSRERSTVRDLDITRLDLNFDDLSTLPDNHYAGAFFSQALHHNLRPWKLIADLATKIDPDGVIAFVGEPIQAIWWKHWGIRLDPVSLFVARANGWFESGWSHSFIRECFERSGFALTFLTGGYDGGEIGIATRTERKRQDVLAKARHLGFHEVYKTGAIAVDQQYRSTLGAPTTLCGRPAFRQTQRDGGALVHGPRTSVVAGRYEVSLLAKHEASRWHFGPSGHLTVDVVHGAGVEKLFRTRVRAYGSGKVRLLRYQFVAETDPQDLEIRAFPHGASDWTVSIPTIRRLDDD